MPKGLVKTKKDEEAWARAKARAHEQYGPEEDQGFWAIVNHIFHKMSGRHKKEKRRKKEAARIMATLDRVASVLQGRGLLKQAESLDIVTNTLGKTAERPTEAYIFSPGSSNDKKGHYPIPDVAHALAALSYAARAAKSSPNGKPDWTDLTNAQVEDRVRAAVAREFPSIEIDPDKT